MKRKSPFYFLILAFVVTLLTYFLANGDHHGFPFTWASVTANPGSVIPIIGFLFPPSISFSWIGFVLDVAFYFAVFWGVYWFATRKKH